MFNLAKRKARIDCYNVKQYENERFVDVVNILENAKRNQRFVLCYSPKYRANVLIPEKELVYLE